MKKFLLLFVSLLIASTSFADFTQKGVVKTRGRQLANGKVIPGERLGNATVVLKGGSSVHCDASGNFLLKLPSAKFYLSNVKKEGYQVADPDMLSRQYTCNSNSLDIALEKPEVQLQDKLERVEKSRKTIEKQYNDAVREIKKLQKAKKISDQKYYQALDSLNKARQSNEKFIEEMADRYSRIDFDKLDDFHRQIALFIQNGELTRADSLLKTKGSMDEREAEINRIRSANEQERQEIAKRQENLTGSEKTAEALVEDFAADCYHRFEICKLRFDNDSAAYWLERRANLDPENIDWQIEAGNFINDYLADYPKALEYLHKALTLSQSRYGENYPDVATCYNNIGIVYSDQGNYSESLKYYEKALKIRLETLGENHPDVATSYNNIGNVYTYQGNYPEALKYHEKALKIRLETLGENHPDLASCYNNIGNVYSDQGNYPEALYNYEKALKIQLMTFGKNHPDVAKSYNNIGNVYTYQGNYLEALTNYEKALKIFLETLDVNHPNVAVIYNNIGIVYDSQGNYPETMRNYEKALKIFIETLGEEHQNSVQVKSSIEKIKEMMRE